MQVHDVIIIPTRPVGYNNPCEFPFCFRREGSGNFICFFIVFVFKLCFVGIGVTWLI